MANPTKELYRSVSIKIRLSYVAGLLTVLFAIILGQLKAGLCSGIPDRHVEPSKFTRVGKNMILNRYTGDFQITFNIQANMSALSGVLLYGKSRDLDALPCSGFYGPGDCLQWQNYATLIRQTETDDSMTCHTITWSTIAEHVTPRDCFDIGDAHWYGGAEVSNQRWPIERGSQYEMFPFLSGGYDTGWVGGYIQGLAERYWLSSKGIAIKADDTVPLFVDWNVNGSGMFCLSANFSPPYQRVNGSLPSLKYHICQANDLKSVHLAAASKFFPNPSSVPDTKMILEPVWTTWAKYHKDINQSNIIGLAEQIVSEGFTPSQLEIDEKYSPTFGTLEFDKNKFPDASGMIKTIKDMGIRVTAWISPFANFDSPVFQEGLEKRYWIMDLTGRVPALVQWWDGVAAVLDVTNPKARQWFVDRLRGFQHKYDIDAFKFDAGSSKILPPSYQLHTPLNSTAFFTTLYVEMCAQFGPMTEVRVGFFNQKQPIFFRLQDMDSTWGFENGLKSLVPRVLYFGLVGYPFVLPDIIGGNAYNGEFPDRELFIRWMQVSAFMPAWQFSITPGQYDNESVGIATDMMTIRRKFLKAHLLKSAEETVATGAPIVRPLWWLSPADTIAQTVETQFLVGDDVMVAPVVDAGAVSRDIYIPSGQWRDENSKKVHIGPTWLRHHSVPLDQIAYFLRLG